MKSRRLLAIDAMRGVAMLCVFVSHLGWVYYLRGGEHSVSEMLIHVGMLASPVFIMISGCLSGWLLSPNNDHFAAIRVKYVDRGLFLLTACHILLYFAHIVIAGSLIQALRVGFITDAIGISMIIGATLTCTMSHRWKMYLGILMYTVSWLANILWWPESIYWRIVDDTLFGTLNKSIYIDNFPVIPWIGIYIASQGIGQMMREYATDADPSRLIRYVAKVAISMFAFLLLIKTTAETLVMLDVIEASSPAYHITADHYQKLPPSISYYLYHAAFGMTILWLILLLHKKNILKGLIEYLAMLGRTSLMLFAVQYYLYFTVYYVIEYSCSHNTALMIAFFASILFMSLISMYWDSHKLNNYMSIMRYFPALQKISFVRSNSSRLL